MTYYILNVLFIIFQLLFTNYTGLNKIEIIILYKFVNNKTLFIIKMSFEELNQDRIQRLNDWEVNSGDYSIVLDRMNFIQYSKKVLCIFARTFTPKSFAVNNKNIKLHYTFNEWKSTHILESDLCVFKEDLVMSDECNWRFVINLENVDEFHSRDNNYENLWFALTITNNENKSLAWDNNHNWNYSASHKYHWIPTEIINSDFGFYDENDVFKYKTYVMSEKDYMSGLLTVEFV